MTHAFRLAGSRRALAAALVLAGLGLAAVAHAAPPAQGAGTTASAPRAAPAATGPRAKVPAANFFVEWRIRPAAAAANKGIVLGSRSATTGGSGFGPGAVVVGTAQGAAPYGTQDAGAQGVRVANGREAALRFDRAESQTVYDMTWSARTRGAAVAPGSRAAEAGGASGHEVVVHHVEGLRVTPWWTQGDTLRLELAVTRAGSPGDERGDLELYSTVEAAFEEWLAVARLGADGDELQVRVTWR